MCLLELADNRSLSLDRPRIMGILNVTPDSFSDGGRWADADRAVEHGIEMCREGADVIDVGGASTRPGAERVDASEQKRRVVGVIRRLRRRLDREFPDVAISVDTTRVEVAAAALEVGAAILNDVSAGCDDPGMFGLAAQHPAPIVLMHMQGTPATMQQSPRYDEVVAEIVNFLGERVGAAVAAGAARSQILIDPGIGFGKTTEHNLGILAHLDRFVATGHPVLLGTSRKRFMGSICQEADERQPAPADLVGATCATTALGVAAGVAMFRVHDVRANRQAVDVARAIALA